jgi:hypothetical protein
MPIEEALIHKLLADPKIDDFDDNPVFRTQVLNRPEAAEILVRFMRTERPEIALRARRMLCLFDRSALQPVAAGLEREDALWRYNLIHIIWAIISVEESRERPLLLKEVLPQVVSLFQDKTVVSPEYRFPLEVEYQYRVCDEAYVLCGRLLDPEFEESVFRGMGFEERDGEIRVLQSRLRPPIV